MTTRNGNAATTADEYPPIAVERAGDRLLGCAIVAAAEAQYMALTANSHYGEWVAAENRRRLAAGLEPVHEIPDRDDFDAPSELVWKLAASRCLSE